MTAEEIAARFKAFCGEEQFRLFVTELNTGPAGEEGRLQEWQASLWKRFVDSEPAGIPASEPDVFEILSVCHVHWFRLSQGRVPVLYGLVRSHPDYPPGHGERFPFANTVVLGGCIVGSETHEDVTYCEECRRELRRLQGEQGGS